MGRALLLFLSLILLLTPACDLLPGLESGRSPVTPSVVPATADLPEAGEGATGKGEKTAATGTAIAATSPATAPAEESGGATWTILIYMNVGADAEAAALAELEEMWTAGSATAVNVLVQMGGDGAGGGARRYRVDETSQIGDRPVPVAELEGVEMAEAAVLADFITWGRENYPASRYALLLWDPYGGGWRGLAVDASGRAALSPAALQTALAGGAPLDVVAFDAGRMGHLEIYHAVQPHARFAVGAPAPLPGRGGDYEQLLGAVYAEPEIDAAMLAGRWARILADSHGQQEADSPVAVAAVDLEALPAVTVALEGLATALAEAPTLVAPAVADARAGVDSYRALTPADQDVAASIDLGHFAQRLARRSPEPTIARQARILMEAVTTAVIYPESDDSLSSSAPGIALYFPVDAAAYETTYADLPFLAAWQRFLSAYHATALDDGYRPALEIVHLAGEVAGIQQPAYLDFEMAGRDVSAVSVVAGRSEAGEETQLLAYYQKLPGAGFEQYRWRDGVHEGQHVWDTAGSYLGDGGNGDFVLLWPLAGDRHALAGRLRQADGEGWHDATLVFDVDTGRLAEAWVYRGEVRSGSPTTYAPQPGDLFQVYDVYLEERAGRGSLRFESGTTLAFPEGDMLRVESRPLPGGEYRLGVVAKTGTIWTPAFTSLTVNNAEESVPTRAYLDPEHGFQFLYPMTWSAPASEQDRLLASDGAGEMRLAISIYPNSDPGAASTLKARTLDLFGAVDMLYEEDIFVAGTAGLLTAYGYTAADAGRTGLFFAFVHEGVGYVVDVDGPVDRETETIALVDQLIESWLFRPLGVGAVPGKWTMPAGETPVATIPAGYRFEALSNGWQRFSGEGGFVAFRQEPASGADREAIVARWLAIAGDEVASFKSESPVLLALAGNRWARANFTYEGASGPMRGYVMATLQGEDEVIAWAEATGTAFPALEANIFPVFVAEYLANHPGEAGLAYDATFLEDGWGTGRMDGATGEVVDGAYHLTVSAEEGFFWATAGKRFGDATYEVTTTQSAGPLDNGYGLILRADNESGAFYLLEISGDGYVWVGRCQHSCAQAVSLAEGGWFPSAAVHTGLNTSNRLSVEADGERLTFFVNDQPVAEVIDAVLADGDVGFFVETLGEGGVTVAFTGLRVLAR